MNIIQESINILEKVTPKRITDEPEYVAEDGRCCLVGEIVRKKTGLKGDELMGRVLDEWRTMFPDNETANEVDHNLTMTHIKYCRTKDFKKMQKEAVAYLKKLLPKKSKRSVSKK